MGGVSNGMIDISWGQKPLRAGNKVALGVVTEGVKCQRLHPGCLPSSEAEGEK